MTPFQIPASKRICMNVEVFQNKARRKMYLSCTLEQMKQLAKGPSAVGKCIGNA